MINVQLAAIIVELVNVCKPFDLLNAKVSKLQNYYGFGIENSKVPIGQNGTFIINRNWWQSGGRRDVDPVARATLAECRMKRDWEPNKWRQI